MIEFDVPYPHTAYEKLMNELNRCKFLNNDHETFFGRDGSFIITMYLDDNQDDEDDTIQSLNIEYETFECKPYFTLYYCNESTGEKGESIKFESTTDKFEDSMLTDLMNHLHEIM
jgi:hypothetical protein